MVKSLKSIKYIIVFFVALPFISCNKEVDQAKAQLEEVIFGTYAPFCAKECTHFYFFKNDQLFEQKSAVRFVEDVEFDENPMKDSKAEALINLLKGLPADISQASEMIGCAGCADEPILYFSILKDGVKKEVRVDTDINELPKSLQSYVTQLLEAL